CRWCRFPFPAPTFPFWKKLLRLTVTPRKRCSSWQRKQSAKFCGLYPPNGGPALLPTAKERFARSRRRFCDPWGPLGPDGELRALPFTSPVCSPLWQSVHRSVDIRLSLLPCQSFPLSCPSGASRTLFRKLDWLRPVPATGWKAPFVVWNSSRLFDPEGGRV